MNAQAHFLFDRAAALEVISDMSKDAYGFRVRKDYTNLPDAVIMDDMDYYARTIEDGIRRDRERQAQATQDWTAHIDELVRIGAPDRAAAVRWDMQALGAQDADHYCYLSDLPGSMLAEVQALIGG